MELKDKRETGGIRWKCMTFLELINKRNVTSIWQVRVHIECFLNTTDMVVKIMEDGLDNAFF